MSWAKEVKAEEQVVKTDFLDCFEEGERSHSQVHLATGSPQLHQWSLMPDEIEAVEKFSCIYASKSTVRRKHWAGSQSFLYQNAAERCEWISLVLQGAQLGQRLLAEVQMPILFLWVRMTLLWPLASPFCYRSDCGSWRAADDSVQSMPGQKVQLYLCHSWLMVIWSNLWWEGDFSAFLHNQFQYLTFTPFRQFKLILNWSFSCCNQW